MNPGQISMCNQMCECVYECRCGPREYMHLSGLFCTGTVCAFVLKRYVLLDGNTILLLGTSKVSSLTLSLSHSFQLPLSSFYFFFQRLHPLSFLFPPLLHCYRSWGTRLRICGILPCKQSCFTTKPLNLSLPRVRWCVLAHARC